MNQFLILHIYFALLFSCVLTIFLLFWAIEAYTHSDPFTPPAPLKTVGFHTVHFIPNKVSVALVIARYRQKLMTPNRLHLVLRGDDECCKGKRAQAHERSWWCEFRPARGGRRLANHNWGQHRTTGPSVSELSSLITVHGFCNYLWGVIRSRHNFKTNRKLFMCPWLHSSGLWGNFWGRDFFFSACLLIFMFRQKWICRSFNTANPALASAGTCP